MLKWSALQDIINKNILQVRCLFKINFHCEPGLSITLSSFNNKLLISQSFIPMLSFIYRVYLSEICMVYGV